MEAAWKLGYGNWPTLCIIINLNVLTNSYNEITISHAKPSMIRYLHKSVLSIASLVEDIFQSMIKKAQSDKH